MKKLSILVLTFFFAGKIMHAQGDETLFGKSGLRLTGAWGGFATGFSTFDDETELTRGGFGGLEFNKTVLLGLGSFETPKFVESNNGSFTLGAGGIIVGFIPRSHRVIHPQFTFFMGGGELRIQGKEEKEEVFIVQPAGGFEINVFRWFRFGMEGGYRFVSGSDSAILSDGDLSSFFAELKFRFGWSWGDWRSEK